MSQNHSQQGRRRGFGRNPAPPGQGLRFNVQASVFNPSNNSSNAETPAMNPNNPPNVQAPVFYPNNTYNGQAANFQPNFPTAPTYSPNAQQQGPANYSSPPSQTSEAGPSNRPSGARGASARGQQWRGPGRDNDFPHGRGFNNQGRQSRPPGAFTGPPRNYGEQRPGRAQRGRGNEFGFGQDGRSADNDRGSYGGQQQQRLPAFQTVAVPNDSNRALATIDNHAQALISGAGANGDATDLQSQVNETKHKHGLRTAFASQGKMTAIATNHLTLKTPSKIYVYKVDVIRANAGSQNEIKVKRLADKQTIFDNVKLSHFHQLRASNSWATDFDMLWSTDPIFGVNGQVPAIPVPAPGGSYRNESGVQLQYMQVRIAYHSTIDCSRPISELCYDQRGVTDRDSDPAIYLRGLNAFLTSYARQRTQSCTFPTGKKAFMHDSTRNLDATALQSLSGFFISARPGVDQVLLNINPANSAFFHRNNLQTLINGMRGNASMRQVSGILKGVIVQINNKLQVGTNQPPPDIARRFVVDIGLTIDRQMCVQQQQMTVRTWYSQAPYGHDLAPVNPNLYTNNRSILAVCVAKDSRANSPTREYIPADALTVCGFQRFGGFLGTSQLQKMIQFARLDPGDNASRIMSHGLPLFGFDDPQQRGLNPKGISVGQDLLQIPGCYLPIPSVRYAVVANRPQSSMPSIDTASWRLNKRSGQRTEYLKFVDPSTISTLPYLDLSEGSGGVDLILNLLPQALHNHGLSADGLRPTQIHIPPNANLHNVDRGYEDRVATVLRGLKSAEKSATILVILKQKDQAKYPLIKRVAELQFGIKTVFAVAERGGQNTRPFDPESGANIALKYNLKGNGCNHYLADEEFKSLRAISANSSAAPVADTIVLGADVTHPGRGATEGTPSIAAVVGSTDDAFMHFPGSMRLQRARKEEISELGDMVKERLIDWAEKHDDTLPKRVLFYRDGVSESQYGKMRTYEITQIQKAFNWAREYLDWKAQGNTGVLDAHRNPWPQPRATTTDDDDLEFADDTGHDIPFKLTYVVVGKRHNTRFYPLPNATTDEKTRSGNVLPGLVVDQIVTHPLSFDFYLQSHNPLKGTGRSAHYFCLTNEMGLSTAELQKVTHAFCYSYARATKGVSYCAPAYYADRLCDRGRNYLRHWLHPTDPPNHNAPSPRNANATPPETHKAYHERVKDFLRDDAHWRPSVVPAVGAQPAPAPAPTKYGFERRNPWHEALDGMMFYL